MKIRKSKMLEISRDRKWIKINGVVINTANIIVIRPYIPVDPLNPAAYNDGQQPNGTKAIIYLFGGGVIAIDVEADAVYGQLATI
jgi:hypothetical protein